MIERRKTRQVSVGNVKIGGDAPISVQSMLNTKTTDVEGSLAQINALKAVGCDLIRLAVPDEDSARDSAKSQKDAVCRLLPTYITTINSRIWHSTPGQRKSA